jgi:nucleotide-binding universal stress UspA family protein
VSTVERTATHRIVVGVDGSEPSRAALRWAVRQAELTGAEVEAVLAWHYPSAYGWAPSVDVDLGSLAGVALADILAEVLGQEPAVTVRSSVVEGPTAPVLLDAAKGADLLVVGSRGHGGFAGALLGSVSQHCVQHGRCPVVVIRDGSRGPAQDS